MYIPINGQCAISSSEPVQTTTNLNLLSLHIIILLYYNINKSRSIGISQLTFGGFLLSYFINYLYYMFLRIVVVYVFYLFKTCIIMTPPSDLTSPISLSLFIYDNFIFVVPLFDLLYSVSWLV
jgi:hypothetical protein